MNQSLLFLTIAALAGLNLKNVAAAAPAATTRDFAGLVDISGGGKMYVECRGKGSPAVVLVPGLKGERIDVDRSFDQVRAVPPLRALPLVVLSADRPWGERSAEKLTPRSATKGSCSCSNEPGNCKTGQSRQLSSIVFSLVRTHVKATNADGSLAAFAPGFGAPNELELGCDMTRSF